MRATELRKGNPVILPNYGETKVFYAGDPEGGGDSVNGYDIKLCKPVRITKESLLRRDFSYMDGINKYSFLVNNSFLLLIDIQSGNVEFNARGFHVYLNYDIKYEHQIDNLCFALTGEELI